MAKQAKRGGLAPLATCRRWTDASNGLSGAEAPAAGSAGRADPGTTILTQALCDHADLRGANLARADLCGTTLRFATLSAADLGAADLSCADLQLALFDRANLSAADLSDAVLDHASFTGANLAQAKLSGASLRFATFEGARFDSADLSSADLSHARLAGADFRAANMSGAQLDYADFSDANLADADLSGAQLRYAKNLTRTQLGKGRVSATTILPFYFAASQCRFAGGGRSRAAPSRQIWPAGMLLAGLASLGLVWQLLDSRESLPLRGLTNVDAAQAVAAELVSDLRLASDAFPSAVAPAEFTMPLPAVSALTFAAAISDALPVAGVFTPPLQAARYAEVADIQTHSTRDTVPSTEVMPSRLALATPRAPVLNDAPPSLVMTLMASQTIPIRELEVGELARELDPGRAEPPTVPFPGFEPLSLVVSLREQKIDVYRGVSLVTSSKVSSGKRGHETRAGIFSILEKRRHHHSNLYSGAPMPWMQRLTWTGTALHGGVVPGYPASHGCVRLPFSFAPKLFQMTTLGANVVVAEDRVAPKPIEHATLFQYVRPPEEVAVATADPDLLRTGALSLVGEAQRPELVENETKTVADAPLRLLVTRRTQRDQVISTQYHLAALGYLTLQNFSGRLGKETQAAITAFQKANGLSETGAFSEELAKKVHRAAGKAEPPSGHLFVRQDFRRVLDVPIALREPEQSLGTHVFTMGLAPGNAKAAWTAISLEGGDAAGVLDRIEIPDDVRQTLSERLTPGSSLIVADSSVDSAILPDGDDFLVLTRATPVTAALEPRNGTRQGAAKAKRAKAANGVVKPRIQGAGKRAAKRVYRNPDPYGGFRLFRRW